MSATEIDSVTEIGICNNRAVNDLTGIAKFPQLTKLDCYNNSLTSLDVSHNTKLQRIDCRVNDLSELDVTQNTALIELFCSENPLTSLDVSHNIALIYLDCNDNNLTSLDVTHNTALTDLNCYNNDLDSLDVSGCTALTDLYCYNNDLDSLDVSGCTALTDLYCYNNDLDSLDVSGCTALTDLYCSNNSLSRLDVSANTALMRLECFENPITSLDIRNNSILLDCIANGTLHTLPNFSYYEYGESILNVPKQIVLLTGFSVIFTRPSVDLELARDFVARCYTYALDREPEDPGFSSWVNKLVNQEICGSEMAYGFVFSQEFQNAGYSNDEYVEHMYQIFFGRPSDAPGKQTWVNMLNNGSSREEVFAGFTNSTEFITMCYEYGINPGYYVQGVNWEQQTKVNAFVDRLYGFCLGRNGDYNGQQDWVTKLMNGSFSGAQVAHGFFFSSEFMNREYSDEVYIMLLYKVILNRDVDASGYATWMNELAAGTSRLDVFRGLVNSVEFTNLCNDYGIQRGTI